MPAKMASSSRAFPPLPELLYAHVVRAFSNFHTEYSYLVAVSSLTLRDYRVLGNTARYDLPTRAKSRGRDHTRK